MALVPCHVVADHKREVDLAPIPLLNMAEDLVPGLPLHHKAVTHIIVQVSDVYIKCKISIL